MLVDVSTVARALELSPRRIQQLAKQGWIPREDQGEYPLAACLEGYAAYLEEVEGRRGVAGAIDRARARKVRAQAELREIDLAVASGELVEVGDARTRWGERLSAVRSGLLNLPKLADRLVGAGREDREEELRQELEHVVTSLGAGGAS